jgi:prepilin peptidase CpaA
MVTTVLLVGLLLAPAAPAAWSRDIVTNVLLVGLLAIAAVTDVRRHKIYNWTTYSGILLAWAWNGAGEIAVKLRPPTESLLLRLGWIGWKESLYGFLLCGVVLLICYLIFGGQISGGDVKMIAMMGALMGPERGIMAMLWTFVLGFCIAISVLVWRVGPLRLVWLALRRLAGLLRLGAGPLEPEEQAVLKLPLSLAPGALAAAVIVQFDLVDLIDRALRA